MVENNYSLEELDNLMPWEKKAYFDILVQKLKERAEDLTSQQSKQFIGDAPAP